MSRRYCVYELYRTAKARGEPHSLAVVMDMTNPTADGLLSRTLYLSKSK